MKIIRLFLVLLIFHLHLNGMQEPLPRIAATIKAGNLEEVKRFLACVQDINKPEPDYQTGLTPLQWSIYFSQEAVALYLATQPNIDINARGHFTYQHPFYFANRKNLLNILDALFKHPQCDAATTFTHAQRILNSEAHTVPLNYDQMRHILEFTNDAFKQQEIPEIIKELKEREAQAPTAYEDANEKQKINTFIQELSKHKIA